MVVCNVLYHRIVLITVLKHLHLRFRTVPVTSDQRYLQLKHIESTRIYHYSFIMPDKDTPYINFDVSYHRLVICIGAIIPT